MWPPPFEIVYMNREVNIDYLSSGGKFESSGSTAVIVRCLCGHMQPGKVGISLLNLL